MSNQDQKDKHSKRLHQEETAIKKQLKIAKTYGQDKNLQYESHRLAKHHAMDCGQPDCVMCGNPRHNQKHGTTKQEQSFKQTENWND